MIRKELLAILLSPKFAATFAICSILLLLSVYIGIQEYNQMRSQHETALHLAEERMTQQTSWRNVHDRVYRAPDPMQIFVSGVNYDIGRWSDVSSEQGVNLRNSPYSDDPIFAAFRFIDFAFIVQVIFSLFAILFTFDAVNGERERGTLRLVFSNSVSRARFIVAKFIGSWLGLVIPICIPILMSLLLVNLFGIDLSFESWLRILMLIGLSLLYVTFFTVLGVLFSALTKQSSASFLLSLVFWIVFVLIIPRAGVIAAGNLVSVPGLAEIEGQRDAFAKDQWTQYRQAMIERERSRRGGDEQPDEDEMWTNLKFEDSLRRAIQTDINEHEIALMNDLNNKKVVQQKLGFALSRISPASLFGLGAMTIAGTDIEIKPMYEEAIGRYRNEFMNFTDEKQAESGDVGGVMITMDTDKGISITSSRDNSGLDLSGRPQFAPPRKSLPEIISPVIPDFFLLALESILVFVGAFVVMLRYDVR